MDDKILTETNVPYVVYESAMTRAERNAKRLTVALIVSIVLMFLSNAIWLYQWCQYDYVTAGTDTVYQQDGEGVNIIGDRNEAVNGTAGYSSPGTPGEDKSGAACLAVYCPRPFA